MPMNRLPFLSQRLFNTPLAIHPRRAEVVIAALAERLGVASMQRVSGDVMAMQPGAFLDDDDQRFAGPGRVADMGYDLVEGAAIIPICGTLVKTLGTVRPYSGMQGYDAIRAAFLCATEDSAAKAIVLACDSPGGEVSGLFDLADEIYRARGVKPIYAILDDIAYSAAYAIASAADKIVVPRTGGTGSIGIVCCHVDFSKAIADSGVKVTFIQYGAKKTAGAPEQPLSDETLAEFQADIDMLGDLFVETVARNRRLSAAAVRDTEAGTYLGQAGVSAGLADDVMAPDAAFRELLARIA